MQTNFLISLFEFLTYLVPGAIVVFSFALIHKKYFIKNVEINFKNQWIYLSFLLGIAIILGVINHTVSSSFFSYSQNKILKEQKLERIINNFSQTDLVKFKLNKHLEGSNKKNFDFTSFNLYRYIYTYVKENSKAEIYRIERLSALAMFSRNMFLPVLFCFLVFIDFIRGRKISWFGYTLFIIVIIGIEFSLLKAYNDYLTAKILAVIRTFLII